MQLFSNFCGGAGERVKVINYLLVATAKNLQNKNKNINKKKKKNEQTMQGMLQIFQLPLRAAPVAKIFKPGSK